MESAFIVAKEPGLDWKMLLPSFRRRQTLVSRSGIPVQHLFLARNGIYHGLSALGVAPGENVLVPTFHCATIVESILHYGAEVKFYDINLDLSPDFDSLRSKIDTKTRVILAIHYFGFPQPIREFRDLCQSLGLYLMEDCAHVLTGKTKEGIQLGDSGDISVFSWRKFLPIDDGGQLFINNPKLRLNLVLESGEILFKLKTIKNTLERAFKKPFGRWGNFLFCLWNTGSSLAQCLSFLRQRTDKVLQVNSYNGTFDGSCVNLKMSAISRRILARTKFADVVEKRRQNYQFLAESCVGIPGMAPLFPSLPANVCPWIFPILAQHTNSLQLLLRAKGIPATSWSGVIHPKLPLEHFPKARVLYENLVFLPVHQTLRQQDLKTIVRALSQTLKESARDDAKNIDDCIPLSPF